MHPRNKHKTYLRNRPPYDIKAIFLYGLPIWIGAITAGWFFAGWSGVRSVLIGLTLLAGYVAISLVFAKGFDKTRSKSVGTAMSVVVIGFFVRIAALWLATFLVYRFIEINLMVLALTVGFGFTAIMLITIVKSSLDY